MIFGERKFSTTGKNCECEHCKEILARRQKFYRKTWMRPGFFFKIAVALFFWFLWYLTADQISKIKPLKSFDPYQILGIDTNADLPTIKRTYRRLSLIKHPDKNPDDPLAVSEFIQITKAYTVIILPIN
jgi:preprotein translocase subunit Sec63